MIHGIPWDVLSKGDMREGLVTLSKRMDLNVSGERSSRAYVALRMVYTLFCRCRKERKTLAAALSQQNTTALVEELATIPQLTGLREALLTTLTEEPED